MENKSLFFSFRSSASMFFRCFFCVSLKLTWRCYQSLQTLKYATAGQLKINRWSVQLLPWRSPQFPGGHRSACLIWPNAHPPIYPGLWPPVDGFVFPHSLKPEILHVKGKFVNHYTKKPPGHLKRNTVLQFLLPFRLSDILPGWWCRCRNQSSGVWE